MKLNGSYLIRAGLLTGIALFYTSIVGMVEVFNNREVIADGLSLGQVLVALPSLVGGFIVARRLRAAGGPAAALIGGVLAGTISSIPTLLLIALANAFPGIRTMFVSITPDLLQILTLGQSSVGAGALLLLLLLSAMGLAGALLLLLPAAISRPLITAGLWTLGIGMMSELFNQMLTQFREYGWIERDTVRLILDSGTLRQNTAIAIFVLALVIAIVWPRVAAPARVRLAASPPQTQTTVRWIGYALFMLLLLLLPQLVGRFLSDVLVTIGLYVVMGLGLNIAVGQAGLLDLGYLTNYAVGAYITGVLISTGPIGVQSRTGVEFFNFWLILPIAVLAAMLTGFVFALPVLRMRGDYLAIATLGFGEIIGKLAVSDWLRPYIGGAQGILFIPKPSFFGIEMADPQQLYYVSLAASLLVLFVSVRLGNSRVGRQWNALREDEDVAAAMGIDTTRTKVIAFTLSAAAGGLAGAIFATKVGTVFPNSFTIIVSINVLALIIVGGMGSIPGVVVGAATLVGLPELLREFSEFRFLLYGALLVVMMLARPEGLWPSEMRRRELHADDQPDGTPNDQLAVSTGQD